MSRVDLLGADVVDFTLDSTGHIVADATSVTPLSDAEVAAMDREKWLRTYAPLIVGGALLVWFYSRKRKRG